MAPDDQTRDCAEVHGKAPGVARIVGAGEAQYVRHAPVQQRAETFIAQAVVAALDNAGVRRDEVDGFGVASFSLAPDHAIDLAWKLGMTVRWLMDDSNGGASSMNMLQHALRAIEAGDAHTIVLAAGDRMDKREFHMMVDAYNQVTRDLLGPLPLNGPNALFAFLTQRYGREHALEREDFACIPISQRGWAAKNPGAVYRSPMTLEDYLEAVRIAPPLTRLDCVPIVSGADAIVITTEERAATLAGPSVRVRAIRALFNDDHQDGDGVHTGFAKIRDDLWAAAGARPEDIDAACIYDDYPVMVLAQLGDLGMIPGGDVKAFLHKSLMQDRWPLNTSGGQLSAGQAGAAGGMHGLVEAVRQLRGEAGARQVEGAQLLLATGYGGVLYTHGSSHNAAVLERVG